MKYCFLNISFYATVHTLYNAFTFYSNGAGVNAIPVISTHLFKAKDNESVLR